MLPNTSFQSISAPKPKNNHCSMFFPTKISFACFWIILYADDTTLMAESEEELKCLLMKMKEESEKIGLKLNI